MSYDYQDDPEDRLPWHFFGWEVDEEREGVEYLTIAERREWTPEPETDVWDADEGKIDPELLREAAHDEVHVTYEEAAVLVHRATDHPDSDRWREQKEALAARMVELLNLATTAVFVIDARGYDIPELYRFVDEDEAEVWMIETGRATDDGPEPDVHVVKLAEAS